MIFAEGEELGAEDLPEPVRAARSPAPEDLAGRPRPIPVSSAGSARAPGPGRDIPGRDDAVEPLWAVEKRAIEAAIRLHGDNVARAAAALEISPSTIYRKLQAWQAGGGGPEAVAEGLGAA